MGIYNPDGCRSGPVQRFAVRGSTPAVEKLFMASFNATLDRYRELLSELQADRLKLPNENIDVGEITRRRLQAGAIAHTRSCWISWKVTTRTWRRNSGSIFSRSTAT